MSCLAGYEAASRLAVVVANGVYLHRAELAYRRCPHVTAHGSHSYSQQTQHLVCVPAGISIAAAGGRGAAQVFREKQKSTIHPSIATPNSEIRN